MEGANTLGVRFLIVAPQVEHVAARVGARDAAAQIRGAAARTFLPLLPRKSLRPQALIVVEFCHHDRLLPFEQSTPPGAELCGLLSPSSIGDGAAPCCSSAAVTGDSRGSTLSGSTLSGSTLSGSSLWGSTGSTGSARSGLTRWGPGSRGSGDSGGAGGSSARIV